MRTFFERFQRIVAERPNDDAIIDGSGCLSFHAFDVVSDQLAATLYSMRQSDNDVFGYLGPPSRYRAIAYMACAKAGAGMLNINTELPVPVLRDLMQICGMSRILAAPGMLDEAQALHNTAPPVAIPCDTPDRADIPPFTPLARTPDSIIGIQYTSGSTGRPKCVPYRAGPLATRMARRETVYGRPGPVPHRSAIFGQLKGLSELWFPFCGDTIAYFDLRHRGITELDPWLRETGVTEITGQVAVLRRIMAAAPEPFETLVFINAVGEPATRADLETFDRLFPRDAVLHTAFAATEHCDLALQTHHHGDPVHHDVMPLGRPLEPDMVRIVREDGQPVAPGEPGEIHVTGGTLAGDYLNDPERTAEAYFTDADGRQWFRTNFIAYQDRDGILHGLGRKDDQVKIRGFNVRPSEIEQLLREHPDVDNAAVTPFEGPGGIRRLACYVVPKPGMDVEVKSLRGFLAARVPHFMVPSVIRQIESLPIGITGKVLKKQLPDPLDMSAAPPAEERAQWSATERGIAEAWTQVLGHTDFLITDDFFDVGGDSLQAMTLMMALEERFQIRLTLDALILKGACVAALAEQIEAAQDNAQGSAGGLTRLRGGDRSSPLFVTPVVGGHLSDYIALTQTLAPGRPILGLHPRGLDGRSSPASTMEQLAADAVDVLMADSPGAPYQLMGYSFGGYVAAEMTRLLQARGRPVSHLILLDPFVGWTGLNRYPKEVFRHMAKGDIQRAWRTATLTLPAAFGLRAAPHAVDDAHRTAVLRYAPKPLEFAGSKAPETLLISTTHNPHRESIQAEWRRLLGPSLRIVELDTDHVELVRAPAVWSLAQEIDAFLAEPGPTDDASPAKQSDSSAQSPFKEFRGSERALTL